MKEPSVNVSMSVTGMLKPTTLGDSYASGVVIANQGPIVPTLYNDPNEILRDFTPLAKITKNTDITVIHAYTICTFMPVLLCRSSVNDGAKFGKSFTGDGIHQPQIMIKKHGLILNEEVPASLDNRLNVNNFCIQLGKKLYYKGTAPTNIIGLTPVEVMEVPSVGTNLESIVNALNLLEPLFQIEILSENEGDDYSATLKVYGLAGTTLEVDLHSSNELIYNYTAISSVSNENVFLYIFANNPNNVDYTAEIKVDDDIENFISLKVVTPKRSYEYEGSINSEYKNSFGISQFIENINEYEGIEFEVQVGGLIDYELLESPAFSFGKRHVISGNSMNLRLAALNSISDDDRFKPTYLCTFGYVNPGYITSLVSKGESMWAFVPVGLMVNRNDAEDIKSNAPTVKSNQLLLLAPTENNNTSFDFPVKMGLEVAYLRTIVANKSRMSEFAPVMGKENGSFPVNKLTTVLTKSVRESLLDSNIMSIIYRDREKLAYLNKNKTTSSIDNVMSEEQNVRLANKINRDLDTLLEIALGKYSTEDTRSKVENLIDAYFRDNITNQVYSIERYVRQCDSFNNPPEVRAAGKLIVDVNVVYLNTIYEVNIYHRAFDVASAPLE